MHHVEEIEPIGVVASRAQRLLQQREIGRARGILDDDLAIERGRLDRQRL